MPTLRFLRVCLCSTFILIIVLDANAQRTSRKRAATTADSASAKIIDRELAETLNAREKPFGGEPLEQAIRSNIPAKTGAAMIVPDCRETNSINQPGVADAYPFLSPDGLRLYFTSSRGGNFGTILISKRKSTNDPFGKPEPLSRNITAGYFGASLTNDELTICMVESGDLYISTRSSLNQEFPEPVKVEGTDGNNHYGPSISPDGKEIVSTIEVNGKDRIRVYKRTGLYQIEKVKDLIFPKDQEPGPGQLTKDGLSYYFSLATKNTEHLWRFTRKSVNDPFVDLAEVPDPRKGLVNVIQPSFNGDGSIMAYVTAAKDLWEFDDILLFSAPKQKFDLPRIPDVKAVAGNSVKTPQKVEAPELSLERPEPVDMIEVRLVDVVQEEMTEELPPPKAIYTAPKAVAGVEPQQNGSDVFPNPFNSYVNIRIKEMPSNGAMLTMYDMTGKNVRQQKLNNPFTKIYLAQLAPGVYTYKVVDQKGQSIAFGKIVKGE